MNWKRTLRWRGWLYIAAGLCGVAAEIGTLAFTPLPKEGVVGALTAISGLAVCIPSVPVLRIVGLLLAKGTVVVYVLLVGIDVAFTVGHPDQFTLAGERTGDVAVLAFTAGAVILLATVLDHLDARDAEAELTALLRRVEELVGRQHTLRVATVPVTKVAAVTGRLNAAVTRLELLESHQPPRRGKRPAGTAGRIGAGSVARGEQQPAPVFAQLPVVTAIQVSETPGSYALTMEEPGGKPRTVVFSIADGDIHPDGTDGDILLQWPGNAQSLRRVVAAVVAFHELQPPPSPWGVTAAPASDLPSGASRSPSRTSVR